MFVRTMSTQVGRFTGLPNPVVVANRSVEEGV